MARSCIFILLGCGFHASLSDGTRASILRVPTASDSSSFLNDSIKVIIDYVFLFSVKKMYGSDNGMSAGKNKKQFLLNLVHLLAKQKFIYHLYNSICFRVFLFCGINPIQVKSFFALSQTFIKFHRFRVFIEAVDQFLRYH